MGTCVICGTSVDGRVCERHQEDVAFEFEGNRANQLIPGRYYRGEVDGFADFGVFIDIGQNVTGLLHRSEIDGRLESLDWEAGDDVYVQVLEVHNNGNVDLGWSIRQSPREFRDRLVHDPTATEETEYEPSAESAADEGPSPGPVSRRDPAAEESAETPERTSASDLEREAEERAAAPEPAEHVPVADLEGRVGERVRLEGRIADVRQTGGPTIFEVSDETGTVDCAAFVAAGERAYPDIEVGDVVELTGSVERHRGDLQVEAADVSVLTGEEYDAVAGRLDSAIADEATAPGEELPVEDERLATVHDSLHDTATALRRAVLEGRPIVIRHAASVDGYAAGAALERSLIELVRDVHESADAEYHYLERRPLTEDVYDMNAATDDVTDFLNAAARHDEARPLLVFAAAGDTATSVDGFDLLGTYDVERQVIAAGTPDEAVADAVDGAVGVEGRSATTLATAIGGFAAPSEAGDLAHLPAVSYWAGAPEQYTSLAKEHGYDAETVRELREALALQAYYQSWEDKRELVRDLLFGEGGRLAGEIATQFRDRLEDELRTAQPHVERREVGDVAVRVLDVEAFTHQYEFPPTAVLLDALHRRADTTAAATIGVGGDDLRLRAGSDLDVRAVADELATRLPEAGVRLRNGRSGRVEFLRGERDAVVDAVVDVVADRLTHSEDPTPTADATDGGNRDW